MRYLREWFRRQAWRLRPDPHDDKFREEATVQAVKRPSVQGRVLDDWQLQTLAMCPTGGSLTVFLDNDSLGPFFHLVASHPTFIPDQNHVYLRLDQNGEPFVYFDLIRFTGPTGFGTTAFHRMAQTAKRLSFRRVELLAAGGQSYKLSQGAWSPGFNGHYTWARFGFDANLHPQTVANLLALQGPINCNCLLDIIDAAPNWWKKHGAGGEQVFDLAAGSRSWHTLSRYLKSK